MHRSPLSVLVIFAAIAACSTRDASGATELLEKDPTLAARLAVDEGARPLPLPDACGGVTVAAPPAIANRAEAEELARQGYDAEALGRVEEARSLLRRASELDGTNKSAVYHLGRTNEALGDSTAAVTAYCRFLALTPTTAESAEARQRVASLSQLPTRVATGSVRDSSTPTRRRAPAATVRRVARVARVTRARPTVEPRTVEPRVVASAPIDRSVPATTVAVGGTNDAPARRDPVTTTPDVPDTARSSAAGGDVVATPARVPTVDQPSTPARTERRGPSRAQRAGIGAVAGAIIGAATGRSVKGAVIGAAAGGMLGTVVGGGLRPTGLGIQPWARGAP